MKRTGAERRRLHEERMAGVDDEYFAHREERCVQVCDEFDGGLAQPPGTGRTDDEPSDDGANRRRARAGPRPR